MGFLETCMNDDDRTDAFVSSALGLIGDFADAFKSQIRDELLKPWVGMQISYGKGKGYPKATRANAKYAQDVSMILMLGSSEMAS